MHRDKTTDNFRGFRLMLAFFREECMLGVVKKNYHIGFLKFLSKEKEYYCEKIISNRSRKTSNSC